MRFARRNGWGESFARCVGGRAAEEAILGENRGYSGLVPGCGRRGCVGGGGGGVALKLAWPGLTISG